MTRKIRSAKSAKTSVSGSRWLRSAAPIRNETAQARFVETAKKLGASPKVIKAAQKG
jgi:hypothetical protein